MPLTDFVKDIQSKKLKDVEARIAKKEGVNQKVIKDLKEGKASWSLLHEAVSCGFPPVVEALVKAGADANAPDWKKDTPLHWCAKVDGPAASTIAGEPARKPQDASHVCPPTTARS